MTFSSKEGKASQNMTFQFILIFFKISSNGSVIVLYDVITSLRGKNESGLNTLRNNIYKAATEWKDKETILGGVIDQSRTKNLNDKTKIGTSSLCLH